MVNTGLLTSKWTAHRGDASRRAAWSTLTAISTGPGRHLPKVQPVDRALEPALRARVDGKAKPPGSLGRIEDLAVQLGLIRNSLAPKVERVVLLVFAGDHGLTAEGVSRYPASVTAAMVATFLAGRASVNAFAAAAGVEIRVVDAGVAADLPPHPNLIAAKIRPGTRNAAREPALTATEVDEALARGSELATAAIASGADAIAVGEMGIGNTASAALMMHRLAPAPLDALRRRRRRTGRGRHGAQARRARACRGAQRRDRSARCAGASSAAARSP